MLETKLLKEMYANSQIELGLLKIKYDEVFKELTELKTKSKYINSHCKAILPTTRSKQVEELCSNIISILDN